MKSWKMDILINLPTLTVFGFGFWFEQTHNWKDVYGILPTMSLLISNILSPCF